MTDQPPVDWTLTSYKGARRETLRRWAALPLERIIAALEEMQELNDQLRASDPRAPHPARRAGAARELGIQRGAAGADVATGKQPADDDAEDSDNSGI